MSNLAFSELDGTEELVEENGYKRAQSRDGRSLELSSLTNVQYWAYMRMRECNWYFSHPYQP